MSKSNVDSLLYEKSAKGGVQKVYRFDNGYGASVVRHSFSYGNKQGLWELAVICFPDDSDDFGLEYGTPITDDVIGYLTDAEVAELLKKIKQLTQTAGGK